MPVIDPADTKIVRGVTLRRDPAREDAFTVAQLHNELADYADMSDVARRQRLHKHMHNEMQTLEIAAQSVADFPDAPWELRMELARQCWDECRHTQLTLRRLREMGGYKGEFPVMNYEWGVVCMMETLAARLCLQNRTFEGGEMDLLRRLVKIWKDAGDDKTSDLMDALLADEVQHVRFANQWFKKMAADDRRVLLKMAQAVGYLRMVTAAMAPHPGEVNAAGVSLTEWAHMEAYTNVEDRLLAGFSEQEVEELVRQDREASAQNALLAASA